MEKMNLAHICPDIGIDFGRSRVIYNMVSYLAKNKNHYNTLLITNQESKLHEFSKLDVKIKIVPISLKTRNPISFASAFFKIIYIVRSRKIKILHSHHRYSDLLIYLASKFCKVKTVSTVHSFVFNHKMLSYLTDKIVCVSHAVKDHIVQEFGSRNDKLVVIYNGIDIPSRMPYIDNSNSFVRSKFKLLCIARFDYEKGQDILLKTLENIWAVESNISLTLIGQFSQNIVKLENYSLQLNKQYELTFSKYIRKYRDQIRLQKSNTTPYDEIIKADVIVIPSRIEPFGLVTLEAGIYGKCVIASNTGGLKEIIKDNENGLLFKNENYSDLGDRILFLYRNRGLLKKFGKNLKKDIEKKFSINEMMESYIKTYNSL